MKIGLDIMGGDFAPEATVLGAIEAYKVLSSNQRLVLIGDKDRTVKLIQENNFDPGHFDFEHTTDVIDMGEHPARAVIQKPNSSIAVGFKLLKEGAIQAFCSAGNSGAMLVGAVLSVKPVPGILRPAITSFIPKLNGGLGLLVDVGANADCKPEYLVQFGALGSLFSKNVYGVKDPKVALVNIGEEDEKGNMLCQAAFPLMKENQLFNFVGNVEGRDLVGDMADVYVSDGFTGNIILKLAESFYEAAHARAIKDEFFDRFNYETYGGSPILGVNAPVVVGHGISTPLAIKNMILLSKSMVESSLTEKIQRAFQ